jgi:hypothetical protein
LEAGISVEFKDHSGEVKAQMDKNIGKALTMIGMKWQEIVTREATDRKAVDTGRYRSSMGYQVDAGNVLTVAAVDLEPILAD